jgi:predicted dinucleotide-binding enzyme
VIVAAQNEAKAKEFAKQLGQLASAAPVKKAMADADVVVFAVWLDTLKALITANSGLLQGKVVVDPSNPVKLDDKGQIVRTFPEDQSSGSIIAGLLPAGAHYVKAFGDHGAATLSSSANRKPDRVALFYATDDDKAAVVVEKLISAAGFDPVKAGGVKAAVRIELGGDLHEYGGLKGKVLNKRDAMSAVAAK